MPDREAHLRWLAIAVVSAIACRAVAIYDTPIDRALPFIAVLLVISQWGAAALGGAGAPLTGEGAGPPLSIRWPLATELALILLVASAIFLPAERTRLL